MYTRHVRPYTWLLTLLFVVLVVCSVNAQVNVPRLRVANFMENPPAQQLDFYLDDAASPFATAVGFADASAAEPVATGNHSIIAVPAGQPKSAAIFTQQFTVTSDSTYTLIAVRTPGDTLRAFVVSRVLSSQLSDGHFIGRVVHAAPRLGTIHLLSEDLGGFSQINNDFSFGQAYNGQWYFFSIVEGPITSTIKGHDITADNRFVDQYLGGRVVTFILTGDATEGTLAIYTLRDDDTLEQKPVHKQRQPRQGDGRVREVNLVPDLKANGGFIEYDVAGLNTYSPAFRETSPFIYDLLGQTRIQAHIGVNNRFQILSDTVAISADTLYTYFVVGTALDTMTSPLVLRTPLNEAPSIGKAWLRLLHAAPDIGPVDLHITYGDGSQKQVTNLRFKDAGDYSDVAPGPLSVQMFAAGTSTLLMEGKGMLLADSAWTLIVDGLKSGRSLGMNLLNDNDTNAQAPMILLSGSASVDERQEAGTAMSLTVWPNPASEGVNVSYMLLHPAEVQVGLYDITGRLMYAEKYGRQESGGHSVTLPTDGLANGTYQVVLTQIDTAMRSWMMIIVRR